MPFFFIFVRGVVKSEREIIHKELFGVNQCKKVVIFYFANYMSECMGTMNSKSWGGPRFF